MKKIITISLMATISISAYATQRPMPIYTHRPIINHTAYKSGYQAGYNKGKKDHQEKVAKVVGVSLLMLAGGILVYQLAKPSDNIQGQYQLARF